MSAAAVKLKPSLAIITRDHGIARTDTMAQRLADTLTPNERQALLAFAGMQEWPEWNVWALSIAPLSMLGLVMSPSDKTVTALGKKVAELCV